MIKENFPCNRQFILGHSEMLRDGLRALANERVSQIAEYDPESETYSLRIRLKYKTDSVRAHLLECVGALLNTYDIKYETHESTEYFGLSTIRFDIKVSKSELEQKSKLPNLLAAVNETMFFDAVTDKFSFQPDRRIIIGEQNPLLIGCLEYSNQTLHKGPTELPEQVKVIPSLFYIRCNIIEPLLASGHCIEDIPLNNNQSNREVLRTLAGIGINARFVAYEMISEEPYAIVIEDSKSAQELFKLYQSHVNLCRGVGF